MGFFGVFRHFLEKKSLVLADFLTERGPYGPWYVCKAWRSRKIFFVNYGQKGGQKGSPGEPFGFFSKSLSRILLIFCMWIEVDSGFVLPQTACRYRFSFWSYGPKGGSPKWARTEPFVISRKVIISLGWSFDWKGPLPCGPDTCVKSGGLDKSFSWIMGKRGWGKNWQKLLFRHTSPNDSLRFSRFQACA